MQNASKWISFQENDGWGRENCMIHGKWSKDYDPRIQGTLLPKYLPIFVLKNVLKMEKTMLNCKNFALPWVVHLIVSEFHEKIGLVSTNKQTNTNKNFMKFLICEFVK